MLGKFDIFFEGADVSKLECVIQMCCRDLKQAGLVLICVTGYRKHDSSHPLMSSCRHSFTHFIVSSKCNNKYFFTISHCHLCSLYSPSCLKNVKQLLLSTPPTPPPPHKPLFQIVLLTLFKFTLHCHQYGYKAINVVFAEFALNIP